MDASETPVSPALEAGSGVPTASRRISHTCVTCRVRKVRCDGRRPICSNCERLGFRCLYDDGTIASIDVAGAMSAFGGTLGDENHTIPRRRARQACQNCHARKARCSGGTPTCDRCRTLGIECAYRPGKRFRIRSVSGSATGGDVAGSDQTALDCGPDKSPDHAAENEGQVLPVDILESMAMKTFDNFFGHIHHIPTFAFLHRASLMQRFHAGLVDRSLLLALVGITSLMTDLGPGTRDLGTRCIAEAEALVLGRLEKPSTLSLQTLVFVMHHRILTGRYSSAFMLHGLASRFASALRLHHEAPNLCFLARESRRRLMWALYMLDISMASGRSEFNLWAHREDLIDIKLPCNERNFEFDLPERSEQLQPPMAIADQSLPPLPDNIGFLALHVRIYSLRGRVLRYTKHAMPTSLVADVTSIPVQCAALAEELAAFAARLPASFRWSEGNVRLRTYSPRLCVFIMTHVWWEQCHCELYRFVLLGLKGAMSAPCIVQLEAKCPDFVRHCRSQAYNHAMSMVNMFRLLLTLDSGIPVTDSDLPTCLYQCARLLHYYRQTRTQYHDEFAPQETIGDCMHTCLQALGRCIKTPATQTIYNNLEKLLTRPETLEVTAVEIDDMASELFEPSLAGDISQPLGTADDHTMELTQARGHSATLDLAAPMEFETPISTTAVNNTAASAPVMSGAAAAEQNALDAFDLDIDVLGATNLSAWFSSEWMMADPQA